MVGFLVFVVLLIAMYIAYKVREANIRSIILDARIRAVERLIANTTGSDITEEQYNVIYDDIFGDFYVKTFNKIVNFGRKHELRLPLETMEEENQRKEREKKLGIKQGN